MATPPTFPASVASFLSNSFTFDPLLAGECISQSANIAGGLGVLARGTVLYGPASGVPITATTLLTTATGAGAARAILAQQIDTTGGQVTGVVYTQGKFLDTAMTFTAAGAASDAAQLWDSGVYVMTVMQRSGHLVPMMNLPTSGGPLPPTLLAKDAAAVVKQEVEAIKNASPAGGTPITAPAQKQPAWATAAFGESKPTPEDEAKEKAAEKTEDLSEKHGKALEELEAKQAKELSDLRKKQREESEKLAKETSDALAKARENEAHHAAQHSTVTSTPPPAGNKK